MKAVVWTDFGRIEVMDVPAPDISPLDVLVKVKAASLCTTDTVMIDRGILGITPPVIVGHEVSGIVERIGGEVTGIAVGDRVALDPPVPCRRCRTCSKGYQHMCPNTLHIGAHTPGGLAEYIAIDYRNAHRAPDGVSFEEAALAEPVAVCMEGLDRAGTVEGKSVAIFGDGPFGMIFCKLALLWGASEVLAIGHHDTRLGRLKRCGASPINSHNEDPVEAVLRLTDGWGADVVIEAVGSNKIVSEHCLGMLAPRGTIVLFSDIEGKVLFDLNSLHFREQAIVGSARSLGKFPKALELMAGGRLDIKELVTHTLPIDEVHEGFRLMMKDKENAVKVVVTF